MRRRLVRVGGGVGGGGRFAFTPFQLDLGQARGTHFFYIIAIRIFYSFLLIKFQRSGGGWGRSAIFSLFFSKFDKIDHSLLLSPLTATNYIISLDTILITDRRCYLNIWKILIRKGTRFEVGYLYALVSLRGILEFTGVTLYGEFYFLSFKADSLNPSHVYKKSLSSYLAKIFKPEKSFISASLPSLISVFFSEVTYFIFIWCKKSLGGTLLISGIDSGVTVGAAFRYRQSRSPITFSMTPTHSSIYSLCILLQKIFPMVGSNLEQRTLSRSSTLNKAPFEHRVLTPSTRPPRFLNAIIWGHGVPRLFGGILGPHVHGCKNSDGLSSKVVSWRRPRFQCPCPS